MKLTLKAFSVGAILAFLAVSAIANDVRIEGDGYLRFVREGRAVYAKSAALAIVNGELKEKSGVSFLPSIQVSQNAIGFRISEDGWIFVRSAKGESRAARLLLARFSNDLSATEGAFFVARDRAMLGFASEDGFGKIVSTNNVRRTTDAKPISNFKSQISNSSIGNAPTPQRPNAIQTRISLPATATVSGPKFTLGEVAEIQGQGAELAKVLDLGTAPVHGVPMLYSRERILARLTNIGLEKAELSMGATVEIRRAGQTVTRDQLIDKAKAAVEAKLGLIGDLTCDDKLADLHVPNGTLEIGTEMVSVTNGSASVTLGIRVDGKRIIGRTLRLSGAILEPAVQAGSSVTVRFVSNGVVIEIAGRVRSSAAIGQSVEVTVNAGQGSGTSSHQGTVIAPGKVEVKL